MDGNSMVTRYIIFIALFSIYGVVSCAYALKITAMLMTGKAGKISQSKKIVKLCLCCVVCCFVLKQLRLFPIPFLANSTVIVPVPCLEVSNMTCEPAEEQSGATTRSEATSARGAKRRI